MEALEVHGHGGQGDLAPLRPGAGTVFCASLGMSQLVTLKVRPVMQELS